VKQLKEPVQFYCLWLGGQNWIW